MTISFMHRVTVPEDVLFRELDGEAVILNLESEQYFGLDEVGTGMWAELTHSDSIESAYQKLLEEYEVDGETLRRDLTDLIEKLSDKGLVKVRAQ
ncbi:MAG: PqqD family protein [Desulfoferrobacter sp.]